MTTKKLIVITGPTCVGKTAWTLQEAKKYDAEIFSADSRQVYKEMSIGTAKPSQEELAQVKHHFINHFSIATPYSVGDFEREAIEKLTDYYKTHDVAILSGGTGLYIDAILNGLDVFPSIDPEVREQVNKDLETNGILPLQEELKEKDDLYYDKVDLNNPRRLTRALEVIRQSGKPYSSFLTSTNTKRNFTPDCYILMREREQLYTRINERVDQMISYGLLDEVTSLLPYQSLSSLQTVGYQELFEYLNGNCSLERAIELIKQNSRRYAKRQMTWFRKKTDWNTIDLKS